MNDRELADAVVALGVVEEIQGGFYLCSDHPKQFICDSGPLRVYDKYLITDWRVAGALMEKCGNGLAFVLIVDEWEVTMECLTDVRTYNESLPRAIIEACVKALQ